jgi:hypothetical protein
MTKKKTDSDVKQRKTERRKPGDLRFPGRLIGVRKGVLREGDRREGDRRK